MFDRTPRLIQKYRDNIDYFSRHGVCIHRNDPLNLILSFPRCPRPLTTNKCPLWGYCLANSGVSAAAEVTYSSSMFGPAIQGQQLLRYHTTSMEDLPPKIQEVMFTAVGNSTMRSGFPSASRRMTFPAPQRADQQP
jgi:hypothetical protein